MPNKNASPRETLARNLRVALDQSGLSQRKVGERAGVDAKTVNNMFNAKGDAKVDKVEKVARVFGLPGWMLLSNILNPKVVNTNDVQRLIELFAASDPKGRENIMRIAEMAAGHIAGGG